MTITAERRTIRTARTASTNQFVRVMTPQERIDDMRAHSREVCRTQASAIAFLQRAGILDTAGELAEPYRD